jgi:hypothetical protein
MDMAAFGAPQSPMLKAGTRRDSALDRHAGLASRTARTLGGSRRWRLQIGHGIDPGGDYLKPDSGRWGSRPPVFSQPGDGYDLLQRADPDRRAAADLRAPTLG